MDYPGKVITKNQVTPTQTSASGNWTLDDQAAAIKNNNWPIAGVPNPISKSLRFNSPDTAYFTRTPGSAPSNADVGTWSFWVKRTKLGVEEYIFGSRDGTNVTLTGIRFISTDALEFLMFSGGTALARRITTQVFRDPSAWYHFVVSYQSPAATANDRVKVYVNGVEIAITAFSTTTNPSQNQDMIRWAASGIPNYIGNEGTTPGNYGDYYLTETNYIDGYPTVGGTTYDATSWAALNISTLFGMTNPQTGQWIPKKYTGTYGTNGFYLNFKDATSTTTLGYDYSGNANNWTPTGFSVTAGTGNDSLTDVPTPWFAYNTTGDVGGVIRGNYCTLNGTSIGANATLSNGNLDISYGSSATRNATMGTFGMSSGKWYWETTIVSLGTPSIGITNTPSPSDVSNYPGFSANGWSYISDGTKYHNLTGIAYGATYTTNDVIGVAFDADTRELTFYKNGVSQGVAYTGLAVNTYFPAFGDGSAAGTWSGSTNFGQRPFQKWNGSAYVENTPPTGFRSLCTTNLSPTAIGFGLTNQGDDYFNTIIWTGNNSSTGTTRTQTGVGFQPDFVWIKNRSNAYFHNLYDSVRGSGSTKNLISNGTYTEGDSGYAALYGYLSAFNSDGFQTTNGTDANPGIWVNQNGENFVAWNWKANGAGSSNTDGQITSTVSANNTSGFSIVTYTGNGSANQTVGHGCKVGGVATAPAFGILKDRDTNSNNNQWQIFHTAAGDKYGYFTTAMFTGTAEFYPTSGSSTTVTIARGSPAATTNESGDRYVMYLFAPVPGYSAFGSYTGNGSADGPFVYTGFRPRFVMVKQATVSSRDWIILDTSRNTYNVADLQLLPNTSEAENTTFFSSTAYLDILSNGFKVRNTSVRNNENTATYIYACFAESPFQFANAR